MYDYFKYQVWYLWYFPLTVLFRLFSFGSTPLAFQMHVLVCNYLSYWLLLIKFYKSWICRKFALFSDMSSLVKLMQRRQIETTKDLVKTSLMNAQYVDVFRSLSDDFHLQNKPRARSESKVDNNELPELQWK